MLILEVLDEIPDPRDYNAKHDLTDILFVALAATLCGAASATEIAFFARTRLDLLRHFVPLKAGAPSHDTFSRVFRLLDPQALNAALVRFMAGFGEQARKDCRGQVAVDGKSLRRAYEKGRSFMPPLTVTVFDCESLVSLSQELAATGGEADAAVRALELLSLRGRLVSADALHCLRKFTQAVRDKQGHYVVGLKGNQARLWREANAALDRAADRPRTPIAETHSDGHDRDELRRCFVTRLKQTPGPNALIGLVAVARVESWRESRQESSHKVRTYALSRFMSPRELLKTVRNHWQIENNLHWQLDVLMDEDQNRSRKDAAPANLAVVRRLALNVLRADPRKIPLSHKRLDASWSPEGLLSALTHMR